MKLYIRENIRKRVKIRNASVFNTVQTYIVNNFGATTEAEKAGLFSEMSEPSLSCA